MITSATPIRVLATRWCGDCRMARKVLDEANADYEWIDIDQDPAAVDEVRRLNRGMRSVPTIVFPDGSVVVEPSRSALSARLASLPPVSPPASSAADTADGGHVSGGHFGVLLRELKRVPAPHGWRRRSK